MTPTPAQIQQVIEQLEREGWKVVPKEATEEMCAEVKIKDHEGCWVQVELCADIYRAMLSAAPPYSMKEGE